MKKLAVILVVLLATSCAFAPPVGETSKTWKVVIAPCAWCGETNDLEVHHIFPQHLFPERAHDTNNMVCLCRRCHFTVGHKNNWTNVFTNVMAVIKEGRK